ncbi:(2,3-dihydroxybenzoyl)adenylate synthase, Isochorismatase [Actinobacteria bacterium OK074]|nr:(2,3-dihydroxybenzoyl)adenylate synthase, Isochorismatase [Actinobacteria bacterium OK074]
MSSDPSARSDAARPQDHHPTPTPLPAPPPDPADATTLPELLHARAGLHPERTALVAPGSARRTWTYRELADRADRRAAGLLARGIRRGDRVVVQLPAVMELFELLLALLRIRAVPVVVPPAAHEAVLCAVCGFAEAVACVVPAVWGGADQRPTATRLLARVPTLHEVYVTGDAPGHTRLADVTHEPRTDLEPPAPDDLALLQLAGAGVGVPRLVPRGQGELLRTLRERAAPLDLDEDTVHLVATPERPQPVPGLLDWLAVLCAGGRLVLGSRPDPDSAFPLLATEGVTHTALTPPLAVTWTHAAAVTAYDLSALRTLVVGGGPFEERAARRVRPALGCRLRQVYGTVEGLVSCTGVADGPEPAVTTQGRPVSAADEVRIVDEDDREVSPGERGQLLARGPATVRGYWRSPAHDARHFTPDGFHRTGATARLTAAGHLVLERAPQEPDAGAVARPLPSSLPRRAVRPLPTPYGRRAQLPDAAPGPYFMPAPVLLPADRTGWTLETSRAALLVLNVQNTFVRVLEREAAPVAELLANVGRLARSAHAAGVPVIYSVQAHEGRATDRWPAPYAQLAGARPGEADGTIASPVRPLRGDTVLTARKYSAFARTRLDGRLRDLRRDQLVVVGLYARVGVLTTAADAWMQGLEPFVVADAVADVTAGHHETALRWVADTSGAVTTTQRVATAFGELHATASAAEAV